MSKEISETVLIERYKCEPVNSDEHIGWCTGTARGKAMRCPRYSRSKDGYGICTYPRKTQQP